MSSHNFILNWHDYMIRSKQFSLKKINNRENGNKCLALFAKDFFPLSNEWVIHSLHIGGLFSI